MKTIVCPKWSDEFRIEWAQRAVADPDGTQTAHAADIQAVADGAISSAVIDRGEQMGSAITIGRDTSLGSLEPGKLADLVILDANPLSDIRNTLSIRYVMKNGRLYEDDSLSEVKR